MRSQNINQNDAEAMHEMSDPGVFNVRVRLAFDERAHPEVVEFLRSIPSRQLSGVIAGLVTRAIPQTGSPIVGRFQARPLETSAAHSRSAKSSQQGGSKHDAATPASHALVDTRLPGLGAYGEVDDDAFNYAGT